MIIKQIHPIYILMISFVVSLAAAFFLSSPAGAYTCAYSGPNKDGTDGNGHKLDYKNGSCIFMKADTVDNSKREIKTKPDGSFDHYECTGGTVLHDDGQCWAYRPQYTNEKPTNDDGSKVPDQVWDTICAKMPDYYGVGSHYKTDTHRCEANRRCDLTDDDTTWGGCRKIGDTTPSPDEVLQDPTKSKVQDCVKLGGTVNGKTHQCDVTQQQCESKGGKWDGSQQDSFKKCTPKSTSNPNDPGGSGNPRATGFTQPGDLNGDAGQCGTAKTNLITCDCSGQKNTVTASGSAQVVDNTKCSGVQVLAQILKIVLFVLTVLVGIAAVGGIAYSAILYASAEDNASNTSKAKEYIRNIVIGLLAYALMVAIIGWLVPGSVIG